MIPFLSRAPKWYKSSNAFISEFIDGLSIKSNSIRLLIPNALSINNTCDNFNLYISGIELENISSL